MLYKVLPWLEHKDYYLFLLKLSWPALIGLFVIFIFLSIRFLQTIRDLQIHSGGKRRSWLLGFRLVISIIVLLIYQDMFLKNYPDWAEQPGISQGMVYALNHPGDSISEYIVEIKEGGHSLFFIVDENTYKMLNLNDYVKIEYLPFKKDVIKFTILTRQAANDI